MHILLFGLSANPPTGTGGHQGIVRYFAASSEFDQIWVLPVYQHIYSSKRSLAPFPLRFQMCDEAFVKNSEVNCGQKVRVLDTEKKVVEAVGESQPTGTVDVVEYLKTCYPDSEFSLSLGTDTYLDLCKGKWRRGEDLAAAVKSFVMIARENYTLDLPNSTVQVPQAVSKSKAYVIPGLTSVSSTVLRSLSSGDLLNASAAMVDPVVARLWTDHCKSDS